MKYLKSCSIQEASPKYSEKYRQNSESLIMSLTNFGFSRTLFENFYASYSVFKLNLFKNCMKYCEINLQQFADSH